MTRMEKTQLIMLHNSSLKFDTLEALPESELDRMVAQIRLTVLQRETEQARVHLELVRSGLRNLESNFSKIKNKLGEFYTVEQFRTAIADDQFKRSLVWDSEPFREAVAQEREVQQSEQQRRREFSAVVKAMTTANVCDTDSNYKLCCNQIEDILAAGVIREGTFIENLTQALANGYITGLVKNDPETTQTLDQENRAALLQSVQSRLTHSQYGSTVRTQMLTGSMSYSDLRERVNLCSELANSHSPDQLLNNNHWCSLFCSVKSNQDYQAQVEQARERKRLRLLSTQELKDENARVRQFNSTVQQHESETTPDGFRRLRPESRWKGQEITLKTINRLDKEDIKSLLRLYGKQQIDVRIDQTKGF